MHTLLKRGRLAAATNPSWIGPRAYQAWIGRARGF
jgi:hypothetical protein